MNAAAPAGVVVESVWKRFGAVDAVRGADLVVPSGEIMAVVGPSGCGKTTLLRLVAGFEDPDRGRVSIGGTLVTDAGPGPGSHDGDRDADRGDQPAGDHQPGDGTDLPAGEHHPGGSRDVRGDDHGAEHHHGRGRRQGRRVDADSDAPTARFVPPEKRRVGMVFQQLALFPHLTAARNIAYGLRGMSRPQRHERVRALLRLVDLEGMGDRFPDELSGGQAQRVAVARALAPGPDVVLLDEPFSSLDVSLRADVRAEVRDILRAEGVTAVLVTHDQDEALALGDRIAVMLDGRIAQAGKPDEVYRRPTTPAVATFLGEANLVAGTVRDGIVATELGNLRAASTGVGPSASGPSASGPVLALLRSEDLDLVEGGGDAAVVATEYFGHDQVVIVALPSGNRVRARLHARRRLEPGTRVSVRVVPDEVVAFPAPAGG